MLFRWDLIIGSGAYAYAQRRLAPCLPSSCRSRTPSKQQRLGLLPLRQRLHPGEQCRRHRAVDFDQRDGVAARLVAAEMEGRDVDLGIAEQAREVADETGLVL